MDVPFDTQNMDRQLDLVNSINATTDNVWKRHDLELMHEIIVGIICCFIPIIILSNGLLFSAILLYPGFYSAHNFLVLGLSVSDFLMGVWCIPMYILSYIPSTWHLVYSNKYVCLTWFTSFQVAGIGSLVHLLLLAFDRYLGIACPLRYYSIMRKGRTIKVLIGLWFYILYVAFCPMLLDWNNFDPAAKGDALRCNYYRTLPRHYVYWTTSWTVSICILIPASFYIHILLIVRQQIRHLRRNSVRGRAEKLEQINERVCSIKIIAVFMVMFIFLWFPVPFVAPLSYYEVLSPKNIELMQCLTHVLTFATPLMNAPAYAIGQGEYRDVYKLLLTTWPWMWKEELHVMFIHNSVKLLKKKSSNLTGITVSGLSILLALELDSANDNQEEPSTALTVSRTDDVNNKDIGMLITNPSYSTAV